MSLGHTNLSYYKEKTAHTETESHREVPAGATCQGGCWRLRQNETLICGDHVGWPGSVPLGFPECASWEGEQLFTDSFASQVQLKFIKDHVAQRQAHPHINSHYVLSFKQWPPCASDLRGADYMDGHPDPRPKWRNDSKKVKQKVDA